MSAPHTDLVLDSLSAVRSDAYGVVLYGLDKHGRVWRKHDGCLWEAVSMELKPGLTCPGCGHTKSDPKQFEKADGHGRLNRYCEHAFHNPEGVYVGRRCGYHDERRRRCLNLENHPMPCVFD